MYKIFLTTILGLMLTFSAMAADDYDELADAALDAGVGRELALNFGMKAKLAGISQENVFQIKNMLQNAYKAEAVKLSEKLMEGVSKNVSEQRIMRALKSLQNRYKTAKEIAVMTNVSGEKTAELAEVVADAMTAGASAERLMKVARELAKQKTESDELGEYAMMIYRDMMRYGLDDERASGAVTSLVQKKSGAEMKDIQAEVHSQGKYTDIGSIADNIEKGGFGFGSGFGDMDKGSSERGSGGVGGSGKGKGK